MGLTLLIGPGVPCADVCVLSACSSGGQYLTRTPSILGGYLFRGYRAIPFVFELRTMLDWMCSEASVAPERVLLVTAAHPPLVVGARSLRWTFGRRSSWRTSTRGCTWCSATSFTARRTSAARSTDRCAKSRTWSGSLPSCSSSSCCRCCSSGVLAAHLAANTCVWYLILPCSQLGEPCVVGQQRAEHAGLAEHCRVRRRASVLCLRWLLLFSHHRCVAGPTASTAC